MMEFNEGDTVKVTVTDTVKYCDGTLLFLEEDGGYVDISKTNVKVELIEPQYYQFRVGDTVRHKVTGRIYTIGLKGVLSHESGKLFPWNREDLDHFNVNVTASKEYTSQYFDKVDL